MQAGAKDNGRLEPVSSEELARLRKLLDAIPLSILVKDRKSRYLVLNSEMCSFLGLRHEQLVGKTDHDFVPKKQADLFRRQDRQVLRFGEADTIEEQVEYNGEIRTLLTRKTRAYLADGSPVVVVSISDVSALKQSETSWKLLFDQSPVPMWVFDRESLQFLEINHAAIDHYGYSRREFLSMTALDVRPPDESDAFRAAVYGTDHSSYRSSRVWRHLRADGSHIDVIPSSRNFDYKGRPAQLAALYDVTELRRAEARIRYLQTHDALTDLPNRLGFLDRLDEVVQQAASIQKPVAVGCFNLDRFKAINDLYGPSVGDLLLQQVARRLNAVTENAFLARIGGDEFALIVTDGGLPASAVIAAERMLAMMNAEIDVGGHSLRVRMSCGMAFFPADASDGAALLGSASAALARAKHEGGGVFRVFESEMDARLRVRRALERDLWRAAGKNELRLFYQPQALITGEITGFEALLRWHSPKHGMLFPDLFIPIAEESGLITSIGEWTMREACGEAASWKEPLQIAVNLSPLQFRCDDLPAVVTRVLHETGLAPDRLELEITESVLFEDFGHATKMLNQLKALGVKIAMDDFGTGYSSLSYLQAFPFDKIKIDKSFVTQLDNINSAQIIRAIIGLGAGLSMDVTAEGVETTEQLAFLREECCPRIQGYLIGKPQPIEAYAGQLSRSGRAPRLRGLS